MEHNEIYLLERTNKEGNPWHSELKPTDWPYAGTYYKTGYEAEHMRDQMQNNLDGGYNWKVVKFVKGEYSSVTGNPHGV